MSLAENHVATTYPLGGHTSRRRRMLAIRGAAQVSADFRTQGLCEPRSLDLPPTLDSHEIPLPDRKSATSPLTWLFVGESFQPPEVGTRKSPGFVELFTAGLRDRPEPLNDPVVDACTPGFRMCRVLEGFDERIQQRNPSVVFLLCGAADPDAGMAALPAFENALLRVARRLEDQRTRLVLNTSPVPYCPPDHPSGAAHLIYAEAVRCIAAELDLPLVDHRFDWEQRGVAPGLPGSWYDDEGLRPSARGHRRIATQLLRALEGPRLAASRGIISLAATSD